MTIFSPTRRTSRRDVITGITTLSVAITALGASGAVSSPLTKGKISPFETPYKIDKLVLGPSGVPGSFDEKSVDCPFVFSHEGRFYLTYVGWDGAGYQTGIAVSDDLVNWERKGIMLARDPDDPVTRYNIATASILRENALQSDAKLVQVNGEYVCAWHAYPNSGLESGAAVIGLAYSKDLMNWRRGDPILLPQDGGAWEEGGLYKPYLIKDGDTFYIFYNAKTFNQQVNGKSIWFEQTGVATSKDLKTWKRYSGNPILRNGAKPEDLDSHFASDPVVVKYGHQWAMYYFGYCLGDGHARELLAVGKDLFHFKKTGSVLIDHGEKGSIDELYAHKPSVIYHNGDLYHFYTAVAPNKAPNGLRGISVARSRPW